MKVRLGVIGFMAGFVALLIPGLAAADGAVVTSFKSTATLSRADVLDVTESIDYDPAGNADVLWRSIPLTYTDDQGRQLPLSFRLLGTQLNGASSSPRLALSQSSARLALAPAPSGVSHFELHYTLTPVVGRGITKDVFKVTFTDLSWNVPVEQARIELTTTGLVLGDPACSTGSSGTTSAHCVITQTRSDTHVATDAALGPGDGLGLTGTFPRHSFTSYLEPPRASLSSWLSVAMVVAIPVVALVLIIALALRRARAV